MAESWISEAEVALEWRRSSARRLTTAGGQRLVVLHPGYPGSGPGPDFRDAILAGSGGRLQRGDVEVHQHAADWVRHGHHRDRRYLGVILQVVGHIGLWTVAPLSDGRLAPTVVLRPRRLSGALPCPAEPCRLGLPAGAPAVAPLLRQDGVRRFLTKARRFQAHLLVAPADQVLYEGVAEAAGYLANREPFRELARALPAAELVPLAARGVGVDERRRRLDRVLLEASGLAPAGGAGSHQARLDPALWATAANRPANAPRARIKALAAFLAVALPGGLVNTLDSLLDQAPPAIARVARRLLGADPAWASTGGSAVGAVAGGFGRARADEIAVNILLPFAFALGRAVPDRSDLVPQALRAYLSYPALQDYAVLQAARSILPEGLTGGGACLQQGLLHRLERYCRRRPCWGCPCQGYSQ